MDYVLYQINKKKTGFTIYLENDESKKLILNLSEAV